MARLRAALTPIQSHPGVMLGHMKRDWARVWIRYWDSDMVFHEYVWERTLKEPKLVGRVRTRCGRLIQQVRNEDGQYVRDDQRGIYIPRWVADVTGRRPCRKCWKDK